MKKCIFYILVLLFGAQCLSIKAQLPYQNTSLPIEDRVNDLVGRLTLSEKIGQMMNGSPAIARLGIPQYNWWNESLHGVARAGKATIFPQAIGMAATFDAEAMFKTAEIISDEGRAKYHYALSKGFRTQYGGLTFWTPNINIFRDPRWGRGQETYGEDPYLTGEMGLAFVKAMQGNDPKYLKTVATAKHYAVHSGPEADRHVFNAKPSPEDLWGTYLPAFEKLVREGKVYSVMCAYNRFDDSPCCGSNRLLTDILRNQWGFEGLVVSDCGAIGDFFMNHKTSPDEEHAAAAGVLAGTDLECGSRYAGLARAVPNLITEAEIDVSLKRVFTTRMKLGMFDPDAMVPYSQIPYSIVDSEEHRRHALEIARKSIVLLQNDEQTLPFGENIKTIAVVGPNAENPACLLGNYKGTPSRLITPLAGIRKKAEAKGIQVIYEHGTGITNEMTYTPLDIREWMEIDGKKGVFKAEYFNSNNFTTGVIKKTDYEENVVFWGSKIIEAMDIVGSYPWTMGVRWTTVITPPLKNENDCVENICFKISGADCGYRLVVDGVEIINVGGRECRMDAYPTQIKAGESHTIVFEAHQGVQGGGLNMDLVKQEKTNPQALIEKIAPADVIVFVGGLSPALEGEEMGLMEPGFKRGDRSTTALPECQTELLKQLATTGKPIVFAMLTGSALAIPWEKENLPAIISAWYGGQDAGTALADVLFGDYNPAGRLPVTFYASDDDLPPFEDYSMSSKNGRTYRYFKGEPLFEFGYGLSYTQFEYSGLTVPTTANTNDDVTVTITVKNTGAIAGEEVAQLYVSHPNAAITSPLPIRSLQGFKRISLEPGESKQVEFVLTPKQLAVINVAGGIMERSVIPGNISLSVGGRQPSKEAGSSVLQTTVELKGEKYVID